MTWQDALRRAGELSDRQIVTQIRGPKPEQASVTLAHDRGAALIDAESFSVVLSDGRVIDL